MATSEGLAEACFGSWPASSFWQVIAQKGDRYLLCNLVRNTENTTFITIKHQISTTFFTNVVNNLNGHPEINNIRYF
jgi:hypothetical protein